MKSISSHRNPICNAVHGRGKTGAVDPPEALGNTCSSGSFRAMQRWTCNPGAAACTAACDIALRARSPLNLAAKHADANIEPHHC
jgi:hypothetical protein